MNLFNLHDPSFPCTAHAAAALNAYHNSQREENLARDAWLAVEAATKELSEIPDAAKAYALIVALKNRIGGIDQSSVSSMQEKQMVISILQSFDQTASDVRSRLSGDIAVAIEQIPTFEYQFEQCQLAEVWEEIYRFIQRSRIPLIVERRLNLLHNIKGLFLNFSRLLLTVLGQGKKLPQVSFGENLIGNLILILHIISIAILFEKSELFGVFLLLCLNLPGLVMYAMGYKKRILAKIAKKVEPFGGSLREIDPELARKFRDDFIQRLVASGYSVDASADFANIAAEIRGRISGHQLLLNNE